MTSPNKDLYQLATPAKTTSHFFKEGKSLNSPVQIAPKNQAKKDVPYPSTQEMLTNDS